MGLQISINILIYTKQLLKKEIYTNYQPQIPIDFGIQSVADGW